MIRPFSHGALCCVFRKGSRKATKQKRLLLPPKTPPSPLAVLTQEPTAQAGNITQTHTHKWLGKPQNHAHLFFYRLHTPHPLPLFAASFLTYSDRFYRIIITHTHSLSLAGHTEKTVTARVSFTLCFLLRASFSPPFRVLPDCRTTTRLCSKARTHTCTHARIRSCNTAPSMNGTPPSVP